MPEKEKQGLFQSLSNYGAGDCEATHRPGLVWSLISPTGHDGFLGASMDFLHAKTDSTTVYQDFSGGDV